MKYTKLITKIALGTIGIGLVLSIAGYIMGGKKDLENMTKEYVPKSIKETHELGNFKNIDIDMDLDYVEIIKSDSNKIELNYDEKMGKIDYKVDNGTLSIKKEKSNLHKKMNISVNFNFSSRPLNYLKIYVSDKSKLESITADLENGDISIDNINAKNLDLDNDNGDIEIKNTKSDKTTINTENGNIKIGNSKLDGLCNIDNKHGELLISNSKLKDLEAKLENGNVEFEDLTLKTSSIINKNGDILGKNIISDKNNMSCENGDINISGNITGIYDITNKHGEVKIDSNNSKNLYDYYVKNKTGSIFINTEEFEESVKVDKDHENKLNVNSENGDVVINFDKDSKDKTN